LPYSAANRDENLNLGYFSLPQKDINPRSKFAESDTEYDTENEDDERRTGGGGGIFFFNFTYKKFFDSEKFVS
jgi:hypothetical protein